MVQAGFSHLDSFFERYFLILALNGYIEIILVRCWRDYASLLVGFMQNNVDSCY